MKFKICKGPIYQFFNYWVIVKPVTSINSGFIRVGEIPSVSAALPGWFHATSARPSVSLQSAAALCCFPLRWERTAIWRWPRQENVCFFPRKSRMLMQKMTEIVSLTMLQNLTEGLVSGMENAIPRLPGTGLSRWLAKPPKSKELSYCSFPSLIPTAKEVSNTSHFYLVTTMHRIMKFWEPVAKLPKKKREERMSWFPRPCSWIFLFQDLYLGGFPCHWWRDGWAPSQERIRLMMQVKMQQLEHAEFSWHSISLHMCYFHHNPYNTPLVNTRWKQKQVNYANGTGPYQELTKHLLTMCATCYSVF